jgi:hypothetical protein
MNIGVLSNRHYAAYFLTYSTGTYYRPDQGLGLSSHLLKTRKARITMKSQWHQGIISLQYQKAHSASRKTSQRQPIILFRPVAIALEQTRFVVRVLVGISHVPFSMDHTIKVACSIRYDFREIYK